jgi:hypothetical protein
MTMEAQDPLEELERENDVAEKLIQRLAATAIELSAGRNLPPGEIAEGLRLLEQYRNVHAVRVDRDLQTEARPVAMDTCFQHLDGIANDHRTEGDRIERVRNALEEFTRDPDGARARLSQSLTDLTEKDHQSVTYENDYPLSCLRAALPDDAASRVAAEFRRTRSDVADLEDHIARYLARAPGAPGHALTVRCHRSDCNATVESHVVPSSDDRLGIEIPTGWKAISQPPVFGQDGTVRLEVDFWCPEHRVESSTDAEQRAGRGGGEGASAGHGAEAEGTEPCGCCGPIPGDVR